MSSCWRTSGASVIGASHARRGLPNQDALFYEPDLDAAEEFFIAVADGHGSALHHRSDLGSEFAVQALREALRWSLDDPSAVAELPQDLHDIWLQSVKAHLQQNPCEEGVLAYGSTALAVAGNSNHLIALQLGDGDLLLGFEDGRVERPFAEDELEGEQTYSLCMNDAAVFVKHRVYSRRSGGDWPDFAFLSTDGVSKSFVNGAAFENVVAKYRDLLATENALKSMSDALPGWLRDVTDNGSGDDASLCIAYREARSTRENRR